MVVKNGAGETIRTMDGSGAPGLNRVWWNLREDQSSEMRLRTPPTGADWVELDEDRSRSAPGGARVAVLARRAPTRSSCRSATRRARRASRS